MCSSWLKTKGNGNRERSTSQYEISDWSFLCFKSVSNGNLPCFAIFSSQLPTILPRSFDKLFWYKKIFPLTVKATATLQKGLSSFDFSFWHRRFVFWKLLLHLTNSVFTNCRLRNQHSQEKQARIIVIGRWFSVCDLIIWLWIPVSELCLTVGVALTSPKKIWRFWP